jgi:hypothetical protein
MLKLHKNLIDATNGKNVISTHSNDESSFHLEPRIMELASEKAKNEMPKINLSINIQRYKPQGANDFYLGTQLTQQIEVKGSRNNIRQYDRTISLPVKEASETESPPKSPSKWRKLSLIVSAVKSFHRYDTKNIGNDSEIDEDLKDYKSRLMGNVVRGKSSIKDLSDTTDCLNQSQYEESMRKQILKEILE